MTTRKVLSSMRGGGRLQLFERGPVREIRLHRPEVHNALDQELIAALTEAFDELAASPPRAVLLTAAGRSFCAGADLQYMRRVAAFSAEENRADAARLASLFAAIRRCPAFVLARVQGAALGGGCGLLAAADFVLAAAGARFGFTEVRLGIVPATISPYVIERIGAARARALFPTGELFDAARAAVIGLADQVVPEAELDEATGRLLTALLAAAPGASREAKRLVETVSSREGRSTDPALAAETAEWIARLRASEEGREGMAAFLEKRAASWLRPLAETSWPDDGGGEDATS